MMPLQVPPAFAPPVRHLEEVLRGIRAGRATPGLVENVAVEVYGSRMRVKELAGISVADPRTLTVEPWDERQAPAIEKAIAASPLGVNPVRAGTVIRIPLPPLTEERRRELTKLVRQHLEAARVSLRHTREKLLRELREQKDGGKLSEDAFERQRKHLQDEMDAATVAVEDLAKAKETEIVSG